MPVRRRPASTWLEPDLSDRVDVRCAELGVNRSAFFRMAIDLAMRDAYQNPEMVGYLRGFMTGLHDGQAMFADVMGAAAELRRRMHEKMQAAMNGTP